MQPERIGPSNRLKAVKRVSERLSRTTGWLLEPRKLETALTAGVIAAYLGLTLVFVSELLPHRDPGRAANALLDRAPTAAGNICECPCAANVAVPDRNS